MVSREILNNELFKEDLAFIEGYYDALDDVNLFIEGYYDALNETSSTAKYLNRHSIGGSLFSMGVASFLNDMMKSSDGAANLYPKYVKFCKKHEYEPLSKKDFIRESKKYYSKKQSYDLVRTGASIVGFPTVGVIGSAYLRRRNDSKDFVKSAGMIDDIEDLYN